MSNLVSPLWIIWTRSRALLEIACLLRLPFCLHDQQQRRTRLRSHISNMLYILTSLDKHFWEFGVMFSTCYFQEQWCNLSIIMPEIECITLHSSCVMILWDPSNNAWGFFFPGSARCQAENLMKAKLSAVFAICLQRCYEKIWYTPYGRDLLGPEI